MDVSLLKDRVISVSDKGYIIIWNLATNTQVALPDIFGQKVRIRCMSSCPHVPWLTAFGLYSGLVVIADLRSKCIQLYLIEEPKTKNNYFPEHGSILYRMRGNDGEITSLSWCPATYNIFKTPKGILIENSLKTKSEKGKYIDKKTQGKKQNTDNKENQIINAEVNAAISDNSNLNKETSNVPMYSKVEIEADQVELEIVQTINDTKNSDDDIENKQEEIRCSFQNVLSNESFKNIITSGENIDSDDAPAATNLEYKPKQRKENLLKPKIDKKNPWGGLLFNDSDEEEQVEDNSERTVPVIVDDFLGECYNLRNVILREETDIFNVRANLDQAEKTEEFDENNISQEETSDNAKILGEQCKKMEESSVLEEKDGTVAEEQMLKVESSDAILPEMEDKIEETSEEGIAENRTKKEDNDDVISSESDLNSASNSLKQLELEKEEISVLHEVETELPKTEYLLASACKGG